MKVSVITIAWNDNAGVEKTIRSVREQDWNDIEHIVIDGGSSDGTAEFLADQPSSVIWKSENDEGRYNAMNKGARLATGDLIWFMHSSDVFHSKSSVRFVAEEFLKRHFDWGYGLSRIVRGDEVLAIGGRVPFARSEYLMGRMIVPHQAAVFSRHFFDRLGGYDENFGLASDQLFMMKASMVAAPEVWAKFLCDFDASGAGSTRGAWSHYRDIARARGVLGVSLTSTRAFDSILSLWFAAEAISSRLQRRLLSRVRPQIREKP